MLYSIYQSVGTILFVLALPVVCLLTVLRQGAKYGLGQRFGLDLPGSVQKRKGFSRIWIHAASVGEVQAAKVLMNELLLRRGACEFFISTMTVQGHAVASRQFKQDTTCFIAPLDVPLLIRRYLEAVKPDLYICLETELWPAMYIELHKSGVPSVLLNGRMTPRSYSRYQKAGGLMRRMLGTLNGVAVISDDDRERFARLGVPSEALKVTGNLKYDSPVENVAEIRSKTRSTLWAGDEIVFIGGSTRSGEEEILVRVYKKLQEQSDNNILLVLAPRHLERLGEIQQLLNGNGLQFELFSRIRVAERKSSVVLIDTMGELAQLYSGGDFNFVGGSLFNKRGHNIMEAARWGRPVYYGPSMEDFKDAAEILEKSGGAFKVADENELAETLIAHLRNNKIYKQACANAVHAVSLQRGAAGKQVDMILKLLPVVTQN